MTNDHESLTEMIILSDVMMAAGFKLGMGGSRYLPVQFALG